jgi:hypothetical protein
MLKYLISRFLFILTAIILISWGRVGHQAIGYIATAHLTPKTADAVKDLLGNETLADVSTYADEIRPDSFFQYTLPWHYIDVPAKENFTQFKESVFKQTTPNVYIALSHWQRTLADTATNRSIKIFALKMIVHLIGDLHQPLHVARTEDKGGNLIPVWFENDSTNLHWLWDTQLLEHGGLSAHDLAKDCDRASAEDIQNWQAAPLINWLYESNQISNHIYGEEPKGKKLGQAYYDEYIGLICRRIDQAGIRLAGILNQCFDPRTLEIPPR